MTQKKLEPRRVPFVPSTEFVDRWVGVRLDSQTNPDGYHSVIMTVKYNSTESLYELTIDEGGECNEVFYGRSANREHVESVFHALAAFEKFNLRYVEPLWHFLGLVAE